MMQRIDGLHIHVQVMGEGDPVMLLHGWGVSSREMLPVAQQLTAHGFQSHLLDFPGFGASDLPPEPWDVPHYAAFIHMYLQSSGLQRVHLIGHSFGGRVSLVLAADHPEWVDKLVLVDSAGVRSPTVNQPSLFSAGRKGIAALLKLPLLNRLEPAARAWFWRKFGSADAQAAMSKSPILLETFKQVIEQDLVPYAQRIQAPTLLIWGELDQDTPLYQAKILEQAISDAGLVVFEGAGHYAYLEQLPHFIRVVTTFFKGQ
jgi:pimeloyl-ACP methyl ester carboxylesterase